MILTTPPYAWADLELCERQAPNAQQIEALANGLMTKLDAAVAEIVRHPIELCSTYAEARQVDDTHWRITVYWRPDPTKGVELLGGPCDGAIVKWTADPKTNAPVTPLMASPEPVVPVNLHDSISGDVVGTTLDRPGEQVTYHIYGIDPENDRWVYAVQGWKGAS